MRASEHDKCWIWLDVVCSHKKKMTKGEKIKGVHFVGKGVLNVCDECPEYKRFVHEMDKEENEFFEFCKRVRADSQGYLEGRLR